MPSAPARAANLGQGGVHSQVEVHHWLTGAEAVETGSFVVLDLEQLEHVRVLAGRPHVVQAAFVVAEHDADGGALTHLGSVAGHTPQEFHQVEVRDQGVGDLDEDVSQSFHADHG